MTANGLHYEQWRFWNYSLRTGEMFRDENLMEENRQYNSEIAKKYLQANTLSYDEWIKKYKNS